MRFAFVVLYHYKVIDNLPLVAKKAKTKNQLYQLFCKYILSGQPKYYSHMPSAMYFKTL